jgi:hypothetical protein
VPSFPIVLFILITTVPSKVAVRRNVIIRIVDGNSGIEGEGVKLGERLWVG